MHSPKPPKQPKKELDFYEALKAIMTGSSVTKKEWGDRNIYGILKDGRLTLHKDDGFHDWILNDGDLRGDDFNVL